MGRPGRPAAPWFRSSHNRWYVTLNGTKTALPVTDPHAREEAVRAVLDLLARAGRDSPPDPDAPVVRPGTVARLVGEYLDAAGHRLAGGTRRGHACRLGWLARRFGRLTLPQLDAGEVERQAGREGWSDGTRRLTLVVVQGFVRWAGRPRFKLRTPPAGTRGAETVLTPAEFAELVAQARGDFGQYLHFLWLTGCRPGEGRGLAAEAVGWESGTATLRRHKTAGRGKVRTLYLTAEALAVLTAQRGRHGGGFLFRNPFGRPFSKSSAEQRFRRLAEVCGRPGLTLYCLRHSFATRALESGLSDSDVAALLGHSSTAVLHRVYSHIVANARRLREQAARVG